MGDKPEKWIKWGKIKDGKEKLMTSENRKRIKRRGATKRLVVFEEV